jgi:hypothetical protein
LPEPPADAASSTASAAPGAGRPSLAARLGHRLGALPVALILVLHAPRFLRSGVSVYDGGLYLTLARFTDLGHLPYRDLWTLYGPGPPIYSSVVMDLFGRGIGPQKVALFLVHVFIAVAAYLVARRFVPRWTAGTLAALVAALGYPVHFQQTIVLLLWGLWFTLRASEDPRRAARRLAVAAFLFGLTFWGRFEFVVVGAALVIGLWFFARGRIEQRGRLLLVGLAPPAVFLLYVVVVVGLDTAWLNLVEYPFFRYADDACRGLPDVWGVALRALTAPLHGDPWTTEGLILWTATFVAPLLGVTCVVLGWRRRATEPLRAFVVAAIGSLLLFLWLEHRPRASESPYPLLPFMAVSGAVLLGALAARRRTAARATSIAIAAVIAVTLASTWMGPALRAWTDWPEYDSLLGWEGGRFEGLYDERVWGEVATEVQSRTEPGEEIFIAVTDNRGHHANAPIYYWFADRPPASRFIEFNPCLTDTAPVQEEIVADLAAVDVVVTTTFFPNPRPGGPTILDRELASGFQEVYRGDLPQGQAVFVLERPNH